jgi:hypothetical protein
MSSLAEIDRDLDAVVVDAALLSAVRGAARPRVPLGEVDRELEALSSGVALREAPRPDAVPPPTADDASVPEMEVSAAEHLALDLDSGETGLEDELPREPTSAGAAMPVEPEPVAAAPAPEVRPASVAPPPLAVDDPNVDLAALLGDSDPMREDEGAAPLSMGEIEPEPTAMFTAEDAARYSRPAPPLEDALAMLEGADEESVELDLDSEMIEIEDDEPAEAAAPRTAPPPPPPRTAPPAPPASRPPPPPGPGFLSKILGRKS